jgi:predicted TIM-barrel fold metal-dependent hydrolase
MRNREPDAALNDRRRFLKAMAAGVLGTGTMTITDGINAVRASTVIESQSTLSFAVPAGACDCHVHVFGDPKRFPFSPARVYTPDVASPDELAALHKALGIQRVVIVTPSVYGSDNAATLFGMQARGNDARGVAVIDDKTPERDLDAMDAAGFRGLRLNLATASITNPAVGRERFQAGVARARQRNWHVQMNTSPEMIAALKDLVLTSPVPVVFDHFGGAVAARGPEQPGFGDLLDLLRSGRAYVKISGAYRSSTLADYSDVGPLAKALIAANVDRVLWGTDWPHPDSATVPGRKPTDLAPRLKVDDVQVLNRLPAWAPDAMVRRKILVDNPVRLYGF